MDQVPLPWRIGGPLGPDLASSYQSAFLECSIERLFYFVWRYVVVSEYRALQLRLKGWYSEDLAAKPGSHKPLEQRLSSYPALLREEEAAFIADLNGLQRLWFRCCVATMPFSHKYLDEIRYRYRFFGMGDEVWLGAERKGRGKVRE